MIARPALAALRQDRTYRIQSMLHESRDASSRHTYHRITHLRCPVALM